MRQQSTEAAFMQAAQKATGYGTLTKKKMATTFRAVAAAAKKGRWGACSPETITEKQMAKYASQRLEQISVRTVQNELSHIRNALRGAGRGDFAKKMNTAKLHIPKANRKGNGKAVEPDVFAKALKIADAETKVMIELQRWIGLRQKEMVQSHKTLKIWEKKLANGGTFLTIRAGSKGGRLRDTYLSPENRIKALDSIRKAILITELPGRNGCLVKSVNVKAACEQVQNRFARVGLKGENSSHSLRRAFALEAFHHYVAEGSTQNEALSFVSRDLGHGEGRGRWVVNNYGLSQEIQKN